MMAAFMNTLIQWSAIGMRQAWGLSKPSRGNGCPSPTAMERRGYRVLGDNVSRIAVGDEGGINTFKHLLLPLNTHKHPKRKKLLVREAIGVSLYEARAIMTPRGPSTSALGAFAQDDCGRLRLG